MSAAAERTTIQPDPNLTGKVVIHDDVRLDASSPYIAAATDGIVIGAIAIAPLP